ncbi:hypothetical protein [Tsukamurella paurometabola]|uniref:Uncharacterized protein n=1 Tax=Tsukamurella paurometabola TaxID=2061 RepID=A0A3P8L6J0_TSUPA|nr:hypothetical protein [Tsukamurella paurometabola]UEA81787.1 hypothetical protein LK411_15515 [Tsukamurella paurometabola]VDR38801.1 Uncharacterised protein [Tsukamurella paurometabola]
MNDQTYADELAAAAKRAGLLIGRRTIAGHVALVWCDRLGAACPEPADMRDRPRHRHREIRRLPARVAIYWMDNCPEAVEAAKRNGLAMGQRTEAAPGSSGSVVGDVDQVIGQAETSGGPW